VRNVPSVAESRSSRRSCSWILSFSCRSAFFSFSKSAFLNLAVFFRLTFFSVSLNFNTFLFRVFLFLVFFASVFFFSAFFSNRREICCWRFAFLVCAFFCEGRATAVRFGFLAVRAAFLVFTARLALFALGFGDFAERFDFVGSGLFLVALSEI